MRKVVGGVWGGGGGSHPHPHPQPHPLCSLDLRPGVWFCFDLYLCLKLFIGLIIVIINSHLFIALCSSSKFAHLPKY